MARPKQPDRVVCIEDRGGEGPKRFRLHVVSGGRRVARGFPTQADAEEAAEKYTRKTAPLRTDKVDDLIDRYQADMLERGLWQADAKALSRKVPRLRSFLAPAADLPIGVVTPAILLRCCREWDGHPARQAYNTRRDGRIKAAAFFRWCVEQRLIRSLPMGKEHAIRHERPVVRRLRIDDTRALRAVIDGPAAQGDPGATFTMACLFLGPRSSELVTATVGQLDDSGRVIRYVDAKDKVTVHEVRLPRQLVGPVAALVERAQERGDSFLFGPRTPRAARRWPAEVVREWLERAGVEGWEEMDTRWLRRTKNSVAIESGQAAQAVADETGHTLSVARRHYISAGAETTGRAAQVADMSDPETGTETIGIRYQSS